MRRRHATDLQVAPLARRCHLAHYERRKHSYADDDGDRGDDGNDGNDG